MVTKRKYKTISSVAIAPSGNTPVLKSSLMGVDIKKVQTEHPEYTSRLKEWSRVRDCMKGETVIKAKGETYLPRPEGMSGTYAKSYDSYKERAHFPLIAPYALSGALGVIITKLPEFNVPTELEYIKKESTKDGRSLQQLFMDIIIESFQTGRVPLAIDIVSELNQFRFVQYKAEDMINWKSALKDTVKSIALAVMKEEGEGSSDIFSHSVNDVYRIMHLEDGSDLDGKPTKIYKITSFGEEGVKGFTSEVEPTFMGRTLDEIPLFLAGSINNSFNIQPIPLISVANCSIQIYRKEADLANSEFLSCNPTLVVVGAMNDGNLPNVVGSSVMIVIPNDQARVFYTQTDTAALTHVSSHITSLYEEAIRHGVAILDSRKGVEAAEALRIRQATQSASLYSVYLSALTALTKGLKMMCKWAGLDEESVVIDAPTSLTFGIPDAALLKELVTGFAESGIIPIAIVHKYLVSSGLLDQTVNLEEYLKMVEENKELKKKLGLDKVEEKAAQEFDENGKPVVKPVAKAGNVSAKPSAKEISGNEKSDVENS